MKYPITKSQEELIDEIFQLSLLSLKTSKQQKRVYSEEDMINFSNWRSSTNTESFHKCNTIKEQLLLWKSLKFES